MAILTSIEWYKGIRYTDNNNEVSPKCFSQNEFYEIMYLEVECYGI